MSLKKGAKEITKEEFEIIATKGWKHVVLDLDEVPRSLQNIPDDIVHQIIGSGSSHNPSNPYSDARMYIENQVGGIDVYRYGDHKDGVNYNKDWYRIIKDPDKEDEFFLVGPIKDEEHHIDQLPSRLRDCSVVLDIKNEDKDK